MQVKNVMNGKTPLNCSPPTKAGSLTLKQWRELFMARVEAARTMAGERYLAFTEKAAGQNFVH